MSNSTIVGKYRNLIKGMGHWSMVKKTEMLEEMKFKLINDKQVGRYELLGGLWTAASAGQVRITSELFSEMEKRQMVQVGDSSPIDALLKSVCVSSEPSIEKIRTTWDKLQRYNIRPSQRTIDLLLQTLSQVAVPSDVDFLRQKIIDVGIEPTPVLDPFANTVADTPFQACLYILKLCVGKRDIKTAEIAMSDLVIKHHTNPTVSHFNELMRVYAVCDLPGPIVFTDKLSLPYEIIDLTDPFGVQGVWSRMLTAGFRPNRWSYDHLLRSLKFHCRKSSDSCDQYTLFAEKVFSEAENLNLTHEQHLFARLMDIYAASQRDRHAEELLRVMWERNFNIKRSSRVMHAFSVATEGWLKEEARTY